MRLDRYLVAVVALGAGLCAAGLAAGAAGSGALSDRKPNSGVAAARVMPIQGIDVSYFQGDVDWQKVDGAGIRFVYVKATEGGDRFDPKFLDNWRGAKQAGIARGAYHVMYWCGSAREQAAWFVRHVPADGDALPPVLDVEWNGYSKTCPHHIARAAAIAKMKVMLDAMQAHLGKRPIIYTEPGFYRDVLDGAFTDYQFWLRSVAARPGAKYGSRDWSFWQFTTTGRVPGVAGAVDRSSFNGTVADWQRVLKRLQASHIASSDVAAAAGGGSSE